MTKPIATIDGETCDFCGVCVAVCPTDAIELKESTVAVIAERCIGCASCVDICPFGVPEVNP
jgi:Fe-S-cluster-containing hydrogenase component 2